jgi:hypothetical protein
LCRKYSFTELKHYKDKEKLIKSAVDEFLRLSRASPYRNFYKINQILDDSLSKISKIQAEAQKNILNKEIGAVNKGGILSIFKKQQEFVFLLYFNWFIFILDLSSFM